jgi:hypothetical protein
LNGNKEIKRKRRNEEREAKIEKEGKKYTKV